ncbi:uncharacterized protein [Littorina saxatilis]|uniref:Chitin-binding type-2 domain-containing protein n=1 Tax=Littorina saxatilis TaxID=31220 RepID=A0AAN9B8J2_9CAEN
MQVLAVVVAVVVLSMVGVEGRTVLADNSEGGVVCPPLFEPNEDGTGCVAINQYVADEIDAARMRRQAPGETCPFCSVGVWDLYPNWSSCEKFYYCLNGDIIELDCTQIGGLFFNPTTKRCESVVQGSNNCLFPSYNLLTAAQG